MNLKTGSKCTKNNKDTAWEEMKKERRNKKTALKATACFTPLAFPLSLPLPLASSLKSFPCGWLRQLVSPQWIPRNSAIKQTTTKQASCWESSVSLNRQYYNRGLYLTRTCRQIKIWVLNSLKQVWLSTPHWLQPGYREWPLQNTTLEIIRYNHLGVIYSFFKPSPSNHCSSSTQSVPTSCIFAATPVVPTVPQGTVTTL